MLNKSRCSGNAGRVDGVSIPQAIPVQSLNGYTELSYTSRRHELEGSRRGDLKTICNRFLQPRLSRLMISLLRLFSFSPVMIP